MQLVGEIKSQCHVLPLYIQAFVVASTYFLFPASQCNATVLHKIPAYCDSPLYLLFHPPNETDTSNATKAFAFPPEIKINNLRLPWLENADDSNIAEILLNGFQTVEPLYHAATIYPYSPALPHGHQVLDSPSPMVIQYRSKQLAVSSSCRK